MQEQPALHWLETVQGKVVQAAQAGSGVAEVNRKAPAIRARSVAIRMAVPSWRWFRLVSDALSLEIPEPGFVLVAPE